MSRTRAQRQAGRLRVVAAHLDRHRRLVPIQVHTPSGHGPDFAEIEWSTDAARQARALRDWANSVGAADVVVSLIAGRVHVHATGRWATGRPVLVTTVIDEFGPFLAACPSHREAVAELCTFGATAVPVAVLDTFAARSGGEVTAR